MNDKIKDIVPELLDEIKKAFFIKSKESRILQEKLLALKNKKASYTDANKFAEELGQILADTFKNKIKTEDLPDGKMYYNIAKRIIDPNMRMTYDMVGDYSRDVQALLNKEAGISIAALKADINQDRIDKIVEKVSSYDSYNDGKWLLDEPMINFAQSIVDSTIKKNADFHFKLGLKPKIVRREVGGCCKWCKDKAGVYDYESVKETGNDVFRRHRYCRCTVDYVPDKGKRQDVWSKKWKDIEKDDKIKKRIEKSKKVDYKPLNDGLIEKYQSKSDEVYANLSKSEREALSEYTQGGYLGINSDLGSGIESYYTKSLNNSIDKFTVDSNIITYRGTSGNYYKDYKVGDTFEGKVFYSTSVNKEQAIVFADDVTEYSDDGSKGVLLEIKVPKGSKALYIGKNTDYKPDGYTVNEYELLLSNKTKYKIEKIENGKIILEMIL
ncbi:ADP-ribosyltransferase [Anaerococcus tetradius]|uniref:ADP ribosyltransferase domain-containing protein n=1 Tax=Anaerococcus tetradius TaxID=33036 RepID=A0A133KD90_9FIRM|nr:ADP-ribosyltransferase [Anaerococcus tetradius]KWZ77415.1 hypothetical protein HMPREF3200_01408 [Anaerococcus tetradius]